MKFTGDPVMSKVHTGKIGIIALAIVALTARAFCYPAEVTDISGTKYFPAVKEAITNAKESIKLVMYTIATPPEDQNSKTSQLIDALIEAKKRGVEVEVILDQNVDFVHRRHESEWEPKVKSAIAFQRLKTAGIKVQYDEPARYAHAKCLIIDKKIVFLGSTNWTESAFDKNIETNVLINSAELAGEILSYLKTIKIDENTEVYFEPAGPSVSIAREFLENPDLAPAIAKAHDERVFDVYLYLLWKETLSYEDTARYLGIYEGWSSAAYRRQITKTLRNLEKRYKLIKFSPRFGKEAEVVLLEKRSQSQGSGQTPFFSLPDAYFDFGWNRELSLRAKFCYLVNLASVAASDIKPYWSKSISFIGEEFGGVGKDVIQDGMNELRRRRLIAVKYDELGGKPYEERTPKMYKALSLYDPKELELKLAAIEEKYGREEYTRARKYAEIVFEENNPAVIEDIILKIREYGAKKVRDAFAVISPKHIDNPKRSYAYVIGILEKQR